MLGASQLSGAHAAPFHRGALGATTQATRAELGRRSTRTASHTVGFLARCLHLWGRTPALVLVLALAGGVRPADAQAPTNDLTYGVKAGLASPGCVYIDDSDCLETDLNYALGAFLDYALAPRLVGGLFLDVLGVSGEATDTETLLDVGFALKAQIDLPNNAVRLRPGFGVGYGFISVEGESAGFLTLRLPLEVLLVTGAGRAYGMELAVYTGPWGGSEESTIVFGPGVILRGVYTF